MVLKVVQNILGLLSIYLGAHSYITYVWETLAAFDTL